MCQTEWATLSWNLACFGSLSKDRTAIASKNTPKTNKAFLMLVFTAIAIKAGTAVKATSL